MAWCQRASSHDQILCRHMASLGHNEFSTIIRHIEILNSVVNFGIRRHSNMHVIAKTTSKQYHCDVTITVVSIKVVFCCGFALVIFTDILYYFIRSVSLAQGHLCYRTFTHNEPHRISLNRSFEPLRISINRSIHSGVYQEIGHMNLLRIFAKSRQNQTKQSLV